MSRPIASPFIFRVLFTVGVPVSLACGGSTASVAGTCTETVCSTGTTWDALTCACVPVRDAGCPESAVQTECQSGEQFDPLTCRCVAVVTSDAGSSQDAGERCPPDHCAVGYVPGPLCSCVRAGDSGVIDAGCLETPAHCVSGYVFDPSTCSCVLDEDAGVDAGCPETPGHCATGYVFDPSTCSCVLGGDADVEGGADADVDGGVDAGCNGEVCAEGDVCCGRFGCFPPGSGCPG